MKPDSDFGWMPDWAGWPCVVVASGPSAAGCELGRICGRAKVVVVNTSVTLAPWADVLYAADLMWWKQSPRLWRSFSGLKVGMMASIKGIVPGSHVMRAEHLGRGFSRERGTLATGGNSGFQAVNLALQFGAKRIALVGFDMGGQHWHGPHPRGLRNPTDSSFARWRKAMDAAEPSLADFGAVVVNASPTSALTAYPKRDWKEAVEWLMT